MKLYPEQQVVVDKCIAHINTPKNKPGVCVCPTSFGKSLVISELAKVVGIKVLILQPSIELLKQNYDKLVLLGGEASIYSAGANSKEIGHLTYATLGSVKKLGKEFREWGVQLVIIDECDRGVPPNSSSVFSKFIKDLQPKSIIGFTATPFYNKTGGFGEPTTLRIMTRVRPKIFHSFIHVTQIQEMVEKGRWTPIRYKAYEFDENALVINSTGSDFTEESIKRYNEAKGINNKIYLEIKGLLSAGYKKILVFCDSVETAEKFSKHVPESGFVHGGLSKKEREKVLNDFKHKNLKVLFNHTVLTVGYDHPELQVLIMGRATGSFSLYYQMCIDMETEILTKDGFKFYKDVTTNDIAYGYDMVTGEIRENAIRSVFSREQYPFEKIVNFRNQKLDIRVSSEHDMIFRTARSKNFRKDTMNELMKLKSLLHVPVSGIQSAKGLPLNEYELSMVGWFLSDGYRDIRCNKIVLAQSANSKYIHEIRNLLGVLNWQYKEYQYKRQNEKYSDICYFHIYRVAKDESKIGWDYMEKYFDKSVPNEFEDITRDQLKIVLDNIIKGDGCNKGEYGWDVASHKIAMGKNLKYLDRLQSLLVRRGFYSKYSIQTNTNTSIDFGEIGAVRTQYILTYKDTQYVSIPGKNVKDGVVGNKKPYKRGRIEVENVENEKLWCVDTEMGTIVTRRKGKIVIMGNCGRGVRKFPGKEECLFVDFGGNYNRFGPLDEITIEDHPGNGWSLFNGDKLLSGYVLGGTPITKQDLDKKVESNVKVTSDYKFTFGKFRDKFVHEVPRWYLDFLCDETKFSPTTKTLKDVVALCRKYLEDSKMEQLV